jgi:histidinol-phosphatase (PHP family)
MPYNKLFDMHVHSDNSPDGDHSVTVLCERAIETGLRAVALTDHCECNVYRQEHYDRTLRQSYFESVKAKSVFTGQLLVLSGVELGQPLQGPDAAAEILSVGELDFVLCSLHNVRGRPDFFFIRYGKGHDAPESLLEKYFTELCEMAKTVDFDSLAHLTYPLRYMIGEHHLDISLSAYSELTDEILRTLAQRGKALEINVSGLRGKYGTAMPDLPLVKRFRALGGEYITVGSDAHRAEHIGANIRDGIEIAAAAGFSHIALYEKREPILIPIT